MFGKLDFEKMLLILQFRLQLTYILKGGRIMNKDDKNVQNNADTKKIITCRMCG